MASENKCEKADDGKHEPNVETLEVTCYVNGCKAHLQTECIYCGVEANIVIDLADFKWQEK